MGDNRRFELFAKIISKHIPKSKSLADIAGGKGYLQFALREMGYKEIETWDKRGRNKKTNIKKGAIKQRYQYFNYQTAPDYDAVVAMHPDEGTDHSILYAAKKRIPAVICPCCIKPSAKAFWERHSYHLWVKHLIKLGEYNNMEVIRTTLPMNGRNDVLIFIP